MRNPVQERFGDLLVPAIQCKLDEFSILGYPTIRSKEIWEYLQAKKWRKNLDLPLHRVLNDIMMVKVGEIINYQTVEAFKSPSMLLNKEELEALLRD